MLPCEQYRSDCVRPKEQKDQLVRKTKLNEPDPFFTGKEVNLTPFAALMTATWALPQPT
jgi:hypothetical protein